MRLHLFILLLSNVLVPVLCRGYYWREYSSKIPADAVPGGKDENGRDTYIGQAYVQGHGIFTLQLFPGVKDLSLACYGVKKVIHDVKILCSKNKEKFSWLKTSAKTYQMDTIGTHPVIGGYDHVDLNKGILNVGRVMYQNVLTIGHVGSYALENTLYYFLHGNLEHKATSFEVLLYDVEPLTSLEKQNSTHLCIY